MSKPVVTAYRTAVLIRGDDDRRGAAYVSTIVIRHEHIEQLARDLLTHLYGPLSALAIEQEIKHAADTHHAP